uniref:E3 ubiquitin-protein ligase n=1 Tax=Timema bartmani TaxID=61472 RepID=A0A7R9EVA8_9NEOP|nr:unnamed protein product [Timema bartmani]
MPKLNEGWWQYDERTSRELETAYKKGERLCELLIAGFLYIADFDAMLQLRRNDPSRRRRIKRDLSTIPKKGIAGLRLEDSEASGEHNEENQSKMSGEESQGNSDGATTPIPPTNTPQTPASNATSGTTTPDRQQDTFHRAVVEQFRSMWRPDDLIMSDSTSSSEDDDSSDDQHDSNDQLIDISNEDHELPDLFSDGMKANKTSTVLIVNGMGDVISSDIMYLIKIPKENLEVRIKVVLLL